ncbi:hypothetical protein BKA63DRAFT_128263 [Paraphoma chrysanthemicola]|nr:hypothetical protein BKA63DRAFT_128263 [Paraphoma chrysanthemicola]
MMSPCTRCAAGWRRRATGAGRMIVGHTETRCRIGRSQTIFCMASLWLLEGAHRIAQKHHARPQSRLAARLQSSRPPVLTVACGSLSCCTPWPRPIMRGLMSVQLGLCLFANVTTCECGCASKRHEGRAALTLASLWYIPSRTVAPISPSPLTQSAACIKQCLKAKRNGHTAGSSAYAHRHSTTGPSYWRSCHSCRLLSALYIGL